MSRLMMDNSTYFEASNLNGTAVINEIDMKNV